MNSVWRTVYRGNTGENIHLQEKARRDFFSHGRDPTHLNEDDVGLLQNFLRSRSQTMGDILTSNIRDGSRIISSLEKLVELGFVKRDWEKELEMNSNIVYSLTPEGKYIVEKVGK